MIFKTKTTHPSPLTPHRSFGFTLIEMIVVIAVTTMLALLSIANYREAERRKSVTLAADTVVSAINLAQSYTLAGRQTNNPDVNCRTPDYYFLQFDYSNTFTLKAVNNCGDLTNPDVIQSFSLPQRTLFSPGGLTMDSAPVVTNMKIFIYPPFGRIQGSLNNGVAVTFSSVEIDIQSNDPSITKTVTIDGIIGRVNQ